MNVGIYVRVSTQEQAAEGYSIDEQIQRTTKYCEAHGWKIYKVYTDGGFSGANTDRPALKQMLNDIKFGRLNKVLVYKLDRLSRSQKDTLLLIEDEFLKHNVDFVSMNENFDTSSPFGRAMIGILAVFAQLEREQIKERMMMGKDARAKEGKYHGSNYYPIGYTYMNGELLVNDYEKIQIQKAFQLCVQGESSADIAKALNKAGYTHRHGEWNSRSIRRILRNKTYCGYITYNGEHYKGQHEAIISEEMYDLAQKVRDEKEEKYRSANMRDGSAITSYLGSLLFCKHCGGRFCKWARKYKLKDGSESVHNKYICYSRSKRVKAMVVDPNCKNKIWNMEELDQIIFDEIKKLSLDQSYFNQVHEQVIEDATIPDLEKQIQKFDTQISRLMDLYTDGDIPKNVLQDRIHDLNDKKESLLLEIQIKKEATKKALNKESALELINNFESILNKGDFKEIRSIITALIEKIELDNDDVFIYWQF